MFGHRWVALLVLSLVGCTETAALVVDIRTDLVPGVEFDVVRTEVIEGSAVGERVEHAFDPSADYARGVRAAELTGLEGPSVTVRVSLVSQGAVVIERPLQVSLSAANNAVTVLLPGSCSGVVCGDGQGCLAGACVDERCSETAGEFCGVGACATAADCGTSAACATVECTASRVCFAGPDHGSCGEGAFCAPDAGCVDLEHDLAAGLTANLVAGAGAGVDAVQEGNGGWWYHYDPRSLFDARGPLMDAEMDPTRWLAMERARHDDTRGWYANAGIALRERGCVYLFDWETNATDVGGDSVQLIAENSAHPIVEWRAPSSGTATIEFELRSRADNPLADEEVHLFAVTTAGPERLDSIYISGDGGDDDGMVPTVMATGDMPARVSGTARLEAGDGVFLYVRVGDDDAFDLAIARGAIRFRPAR